jgi:hypothetical protein
MGGGMSAPFVASLRARPGAVVIGSPGAAAWTIRVQLAEAWDAVRVSMSPETSVADVKRHALDALDPAAMPLDTYVITHRGFEILDESLSIAAAGIVNGATLLIQYRHRRPVR